MSFSPQLLSKSTVISSMESRAQRNQRTLCFVVLADAVLSETHRTWNRPEAAELARLYALVAPNYAAVIESYQKAQDVAKQPR